MKASIGFHASLLDLRVITTFLKGLASLVSYNIMLLSLAQAANKFVSTRLKATSCILSTPHFIDLMGSFRSCSHNWQTSPQVAIIGFLRWWVTPVRIVLLKIVLTGSSSSPNSGGLVFQVLIVLSSPTVIKCWPSGLYARPLTIPIVNKNNNDEKSSQWEINYFYYNKLRYNWYTRKIIII